MADSVLSADEWTKLAAGKQVPIGDIDNPSVFFAHPPDDEGRGVAIDQGVIVSLFYASSIEKLMAVCNAALPDDDRRITRAWVERLRLASRAGDLDPIADFLERLIPPT